MTSILERAEQLAAELKQHLLPDSAPWIGFQGWRNLLFASWPLPIEQVRPIVPSSLVLDTYQSSAWVSLVPMRVEAAHIRDLPPIPGFEAFTEINLRTYINLGGEHGVYFITIDCSDSIADWLADRLFHVPYMRASQTMLDQDGTFYFESRRTQSSAPPASFAGRYTPAGDAFSTSADPLAHFLLERYFLALEVDGVVHRANMMHPAWSIQHVEAELEVDDIPGAAGINLSGPPVHLAYAAATNTLIYPLMKVSDPASSAGA